MLLEALDAIKKIVENQNSDLQKKVPDRYNKEEALQYNSKLSYSKMCNKNAISRVFCT